MAIDTLPGSTRQTATGPNYYHADPTFQALMQEALGPEVLAWARPLLEDMGRMAAQDIVPLAEEANQNPPVLVQYDANGNRIDEVKIHPSYRELTRLAYGAGLGGMFYEPDLRKRHGYVPHSLVFGLGYLFAQAEQGLYCPICMTEGSARLVDLFGDADLKAKYLPGITSRDLETLLEGAMFLTEKQGGSDVGANETVARRVDGQWRLYGDKWFCSNAGEAGVMMVLARPEGAQPGTRGLGLFLMPKTLDDGSRNHYRIHRLKDKLGTRSMASGEFTLDGAIAYPLGDLGRGFRYMTEMLNLSRTYNAVAALAIMRRAYVESLAHATERAAFGKTIDHYPMVRQMLTSMVVELEAATAFVWEAIRYLDKVDQGTATEGEQAMRRLLTPMIKYHTGKQAIRFASEACEMLGGNGYIETFVTPRLLRDAQVLPIWEGTTNILVLDVVRCLGREGAGPLLLAELRRRLSEAKAEALAPWRTYLAGEVDRLEKALGDLAGQDEVRMQLHAKTWSDRAIRLYEAILLLGPADRELGRGNARKLAVLAMHVDRFLAPKEFGAEGWSGDAAPHALFEGLAHHAPLTLDTVLASIRKP